MLQIYKYNTGIIFHRYSPRGKSLKTGIVAVARHSHQLSINCSKIVNTNHPIKIKHLHILCTKCLTCHCSVIWNQTSVFSLSIQLELINFEVLKVNLNSKGQQFPQYIKKRTITSYVNSPTNKQTTTYVVCLNHYVT